jgi:hypothetical protein
VFLRSPLSSRRCVCVCVCARHCVLVVAASVVAVSQAAAGGESEVEVQARLDTLRAGAQKELRNNELTMEVRPSLVL